MNDAAPKKDSPKPPKFPRRVEPAEETVRDQMIQANRTAAVLFPCYVLGSMALMAGVVSWDMDWLFAPILFSIAVSAMMTRKYWLCCCAGCQKRLDTRDAEYASYCRYCGMDLDTPLRLIPNMPPRKKRI